MTFPNPMSCQISNSLIFIEGVSPVSFMPLMSHQFHIGFLSCSPFIRFFLKGFISGFFGVSLWFLIGFHWKFHLYKVLTFQIFIGCYLQCHKFSSSVFVSRCLNNHVGARFFWGRGHVRIRLNLFRISFALFVSRLILLISFVSFQT